MPLAMNHLMLWIDHAGEVIRPTHGLKMIRHSKNSRRLCCIVFTHSFETWSMAHVTHNHGHQPIVLQIQNELEKSSSYRNFRIYAPQPHENSMFVHSSLPQLNKLLSVYQLAVFLCLELCFGALCPALHFNCCTIILLYKMVLFCWTLAFTSFRKPAGFRRKALWLSSQLWIDWMDDWVMWCSCLAVKERFYHVDVGGRWYVGLQFYQRYYSFQYVIIACF